MNAQPEEIASIDGFGEIGAEKVHAFFANEENRRVTQELLKELKLIREGTDREYTACRENRCDYGLTETF